LWGFEEIQFENQALESVHVNDKQMINYSKMTGWRGKIEATNLALMVMF
jgi:hypothetical protein